LTGVRRSEGLRITSENFDLDQMVATLPQHKQRTHKTIPIGQDLAAVVTRMVARVGPGKPLVQLHPSRLTDNFRAARKRAELPPSLTFHSSRHYAELGITATPLPHGLRGLKRTSRRSKNSLGIVQAKPRRFNVHAFDPNKRLAIEKLLLPRKAINA
jgi:integrase